MSKSTTRVMIEEQLKWAYQGSHSLNGRIDWAEVNRLCKQLKALTN